MLAAYWLAQLSAWGFHFWWQASGESIFASVPFGRAATVWGGFCVAGIASTELLRRFSKNMGWLDLAAGRLLGRLVTSVLVLTVIGCVVIAALSMMVYNTPVTAIFRFRALPLSMQLFNEIRSTLFVFVTWIAVYFSIALISQRYSIELRHARLAESLQAAELRLLKSQLNPHFLFNALNGVRALIADEPVRAQESVTQLACTLRYMLDSGREEFVTLAHEQEMVEHYLALESLRLADRLRVVREIDPRANTARIPFMLLQSLVENAIKHGISQLREGGTLRIAASMVENELMIEVENPRPTRSVSESSSGVGLKNTARRLELLFGVRASLHLDLSDARLAKATARLPS